MDAIAEATCRSFRMRGRSHVAFTLPISTAGWLANEISVALRTRTRGRRHYQDHTTKLIRLGG